MKIYIKLYQVNSVSDKCCHFANSLVPFHGRWLIVSSVIKSWLQSPAKQRPARKKWALKQIIEPNWRWQFWLTHAPTWHTLTHTHCLSHPATRSLTRTPSLSHTHAPCFRKMRRDSFWPFMEVSPFSTLKVLAPAQFGFFFSQAVLVFVSPYYA